MKRKSGPKPSIGDREAGLVEAINISGSITALAKKLGISPQAITLWKRIPSNRLLQIEEVTGIPRERLRPDLYRK
jgi:DNA-binding transcriptional regulator YdaS (Cro superfamily)